MLDGNVQEIATHNQFCFKKALPFHGRSELIEKCFAYFEKSDIDKRKPFVVHGNSGDGKTSLMVSLAYKALRKTSESGQNPVIVVRFCGTTTKSSNARGV